jgi:hypothetical protein
MNIAPNITAALDTAAIPLFKVGPARHSRLAHAERDLYFWILRRFAERGRPSAAETWEAAGGLGLDPARALQTMATEDLVHTGGDGEITVAYPFSGRPTEHHVRFEDGHEVYAMCAIDALGIAPMFDQSIEFLSNDPLTGERIEVVVTRDGTGKWQPEEAAVVCGASGGGESCCSCCPVLNFFASAENGERWLEGRPDVRGQVMTMRHAVEVGRTVFGEVFASDSHSELPSSA